MVIISGNMY